MYSAWQTLKPGDVIDIIAPASACPNNERAKVLTAVKELLLSWDLIPNIPDAIWGDDLLCANSDAIRLQQLQQALCNKQSKAVWCLRGGYGAMRLLPELKKLPAQPCKLFMGMSDITALHVFLQQQWNWSTLHAGSIRQAALKLIKPENITEIKNIIFGQEKTLSYNLVPMNAAAKNPLTIRSVIAGGNLTLVQTSLGTFWQIDAREKILFLEEISERGYRVDRMLQHLLQAGVFNNVAAVIFGDFIKGVEPDGTSLIDPVLQQFADEQQFAVLRCKGIGHDDFNRPLPLGSETVLMLGEEPLLQICFS